MTARTLAAFSLSFLVLLVSRTSALPPQTTHGVLQSVPVPRGGVTIEGDLEQDWDRAGRMFVYNAVNLRHKYSVEVFSMWDAHAWYVGLHFKDPTPLLNNVDAEGAPFDGWQSDGFQGRFTTDYGQMHFDAWYSSKSDMSVAAISYDAPLNTANSKLFRTRGKTLRDGSGFQMAFRPDADQRGYVQEIRFPWALLYRSVPPIQAGLKFRFTGEYYWGGPTGIKWPKVLWSDPINPEQPVRIVVYQNPAIWGTCELLGDRNQARGDPVDEGEDDLGLQGPIPIRVEVPEEAVKFSLVLDGADGRRVRNLAAHADVSRYTVSRSGGRRVLEVPWDGRADGGWDKERMLFLGDVVAPGQYTARVLTHRGVGVTHAGSFYNPGTPPWPTADGSGSWLSDHAPPLAVAAMSPASPRTKGRTLLIARLAESGVAFIGLDHDGRKIWQWVRNTAELLAVAGGDKHAYFAFTYVGKPYLGRLNPDDGQQERFGNGQQDLALPGEATAVAVRGERVAVAIKGSRDVLLFDAESGNPVKTLTVRLNPDADGEITHLAFAPDGRLVGLLGRQLFAAGVGDGQVVGWTVPGVEEPHAVTVDSAGRLYVAGRKNANVRVFDRVAADARPIAVVGSPGGRRPGRFDPRQMAAPRSLAVDERPDGTRHLWCVEDIYHPRRVVVWDLGTLVQIAASPAALDGSAFKVVRDYVGGTGYCGTGGLLSDDVPDLGIVNGIEFQLDFANYAYTPLRVMGGAPDAAAGRTALFHVGAFPGMFGNGFHFISRASGRPVESYVEGHGLCMVFLRRGERWHCVAALGNAGHGVPFPPGFPQPDPNAGKTTFCWNDLNGDGYQQPDELQWAAVGEPKALWQGNSWGYRCDSDLAWYHSGLAFKPVRFTAEGAPVYDVSRVERLPGELGRRGHVGEVFRTRFGYVLQAARPNYQDPHGTIHGLIQLEGYDAAGTLRWTYPSYWNSVHGAFTAPMAIPGVIMGALKISGIVHLDGFDVIALRGNIGQEFLIRDDGLYVGELFTDQRMAPEELPPDERIAGIPINDTSLGGEPFSGWIARQNDGKVRLTYGLNDVRIAEVVGLDSIQVQPPLTLTVSDQQMQAARSFVPQRTTRRNATDYTIARGAEFSLADLRFDAGAISIRSGRDEVAQAMLRGDDRHLYAAWRVADPTPWVNQGQAAELAFKSGDGVDLFVAADGDYDRNAPGGTRVLLAPVQGRPVAIVFRPNGPGDRPFVFESPVRKSPFRYVAVEPAVRIQAAAAAQEYTVVAAIPWDVLGLQPAAGLKLRGDAGVILGGSSPTAVDRLVRWVDQQTNVVNDVPTEAEFFPGRWGHFLFESRR